MQETSLIKRTELWKQIKPYRGLDLIKVITGLRRSGKSYFIEQIILELELKPSEYIYINKEDLDFDEIRNYKDLDQYIKSNSCKNTKYLFIDEIQEIEEWERAVRSYLKKKEFDIYITGSNAQMLSSELSTFLAGRYIEFSIYPLSYREFLTFSKQEKSEQSFMDFVKYGGMPGIYNLHSDAEMKYNYLKSIFNTIVLKDIVKKYEVRNINLLENIIKFCFDNIGSSFSAKSISDYLKSQRMKVGVTTVLNYLSYLESAYLIYKVRRYDLQGKRHLEIYEKYYLADLGFRHCLLHYREDDINDFLENIVYLELKRRGYEVSVGKYDDMEIDFIAVKQGKKLYIQVAYLLATKDVLARELKPLKKIGDNYPKLILSMDKLYGSDIDGIDRMNLVDWLC